MRYTFAIIIGFFLITPVGHAATVSFAGPDIAVVGTQISVDVLVDSKGVAFNSLDIVVGYSSNVSFAGYAESETIPVWIVPPRVEKGGVHFAGIIPGGVERTYDPEHPTNHNVKLLKLFFHADTPGPVTFTASQSQILQNDGLGTKLPIDIQDKTVLVKNISTPLPKSLESTDAVLPEPFTIEIIERSFFGRTPRLAVFSAVDRGHGISRYEANVTGNWKGTVSSPYPLPNKLFSYTLVIRAFDFSDNFRDEAIVVPGSKSYILYSIGVLGTIGVLIYTYYIRRKRHEIEKHTT